MSSSNPFEDLETEFQNVDKAGPGMSAGRLPPHPAYRGMCIAFEVKDGEQVDKEYFRTPSGTKAVRIRLEIIEPEKVEDEEVKGRPYEHVFWVTVPNLPYVKRDASIILGTEITKLEELLTSVWAGKTVEFGAKDETYLGFLRSKVTHFNPWTPEKAAEKKVDPKTEVKKPVLGKVAGSVKF